MEDSNSGETIETGERKREREREWLVSFSNKTGIVIVHCWDICTGVRVRTQEKWRGGWMNLCGSERVRLFSFKLWSNARLQTTKTSHRAYTAFYCWGIIRGTIPPPASPWRTFMAHKLLYIVSQFQYNIWEVSKLRFFMLFLFDLCYWMNLLFSL